MGNNRLVGHPDARDFLYRDDFTTHPEHPAVVKGELIGMRPNSRHGISGLELDVGISHPLRPSNDASQQSRWVGFRGRTRGAYISPVIETELPFHEILPSWNIRLDERTQGYRILLRVGDDIRGWSRWLDFGAAGNAATRRSYDKLRRGHAARSNRRNLNSYQVAGCYAEGWGKVEIDYLRLQKPATRIQYRVELESSGHAAAKTHSGPPALLRFFISYSNTADTSAPKTSPSPSSGSQTTTVAPKVIPVPYRRQHAVPVPRLRNEICCATCVAMVLESHGHDLSTLNVCAQALDTRHGIYGAWPRAAQTASRHGLEAWVQRFRQPEDVKRLIAAGVPVMASIRVRPGELSNAAHRVSGGHLILVRGFTAEGDFVVNDPAAPGPDGAEIIYRQSEIEKVWFDKGGVGIVIRSPQPQNAGPVSNTSEEPHEELSA